MTAPTAQEQYCLTNGLTEMSINLLISSGKLNFRFFQLRMTGMGRGCAETLTEIYGQKIDRIERPTSDDRHLWNGFGTSNIFVNRLDFEFLHRLGTAQKTTNDC